MEGYISHSLANIFTSQPKGFSKPILAKRLALRALYLNSFDDTTNIHKSYGQYPNCQHFHKSKFLYLK